MSKKMKLNLEDLKVHSFITSLNDDEKDRFRGGTDETQKLTCTSCSIDLCNCVTNNCDPDTELPLNCRLQKDE